jgi:anthranilate synthase component 2
MKILLIDNYDSFTCNLLHLIKSASKKEDVITVCPRDELDIVRVTDFNRVVISPGPGIPSEAGRLGDAIQACEGRMPLLGICLGHQAIAEYYGARVYNMEKPAHGIRSAITIRDNRHLFLGMNQKIAAGRYHSWCVAKENLPDCLNITAVDETGNIMALSHREYRLHGVQFHPESFMTEEGGAIMSNFLKG